MDTAAQWSRHHRDLENGGIAHRRTGMAIFTGHGVPPAALPPPVLSARNTFDPVAKMGRPVEEFLPWP